MKLNKLNICLEIHELSSIETFGLWSPDLTGRLCYRPPRLITRKVNLKPLLWQKLAASPAALIKLFICATSHSRDSKSPDPEGFGDEDVDMNGSRDSCQFSDGRAARTTAASRSIDLHTYKTCYKASHLKYLIVKPNQRHDGVKHLLQLLCCSLMKASIKLCTVQWNVLVRGSAASHAALLFLSLAVKETSDFN